MFLINIRILDAHETKLMTFHIHCLLFHFTSTIKYSRQICMGIYNGSCYALAIVNPHSDLLLVFYLLLIESNSLVKVFDSHARDSFSMSHTYGTCVLLEFDSVNNLIEYFKFLYRPDVIYEIKGVKINNACSALTENVDTNVITPPAVGEAEF